MNYSRSPFSKIKEKYRRGKKSNVDEEELADFLQADLAKAREGVLYIGQGLRLKDNSVCLMMGGLQDIASDVLSGTGAVVDNFATLGMKATSAAVGVAKVPVDTAVAHFVGEGQSGREGPQQSTIAMRLKEWFSRKAHVLWQSLTKGSLAKPMFWKVFAEKLIDALVSNLTSLVVPLGGAFDVVKGTIAALDAGYQRMMSWLDSRSVPFVRGHPTVLVQSIEKTINCAIGAGLWTAVKGAGQIAGDVAAAGAGTLAKAIATALEILYQLIHRAAEIGYCKRFAKEAKDKWKARPGSIDNPEEFADWLKSYVMKAPALGALLMNSGYCGSPMNYLAMQVGDDPATSAIISQKDFETGVSMLHRLKIFAANYLGDVGYEFHSDQPNVEAAIRLAVNYGKIPFSAMSTSAKVLDVLKA